MSKKKQLHKELGLLSVFAIAAGTTLSAGFFLLPGLAAHQAGPAIVLAYLIAAIPMVPAMLSMVELATAMPRAGGMYFFLDRALGPMFGTIGGIGSWLALILKVAFALIGMGAYIAVFFPDINVKPLAVFLAIALGAVNLFSVKKSGKLQAILVLFLLSFLIIFIGGGIPNIEWGHFEGFFDAGTVSIFSTAGMVYISYVGITNVASLSEEISSPEKNLPRGVILALTAAILIYILGTAVMVGTLPMDKLSNTLTPVADAAGVIFGKFGTVLLSIGAILAFISVANAGAMSASRYPLAMSRDLIFPHVFKKINNFGTPTVSIILTTLLILGVIVFLNPTKIAKLASAFQLMLYGTTCLAVIIMRESKIESYDPGFLSPLYPWMQIFGILSAVWLIGEMGLFSILFSLGLLVAGFLWYWYYARSRVTRSGAIYHIFERLGKARYEPLDSELRQILKEKGVREEDSFEEIITKSWVIDIKEKLCHEEIVKKAATALAQTTNIPKTELEEKFLEGTRIGATPVVRGIALPHFRSPKVDRPQMALVRSIPGIEIQCESESSFGDDEAHDVHAMFFLVSPEDNPGQHLRILAQVAGRVEEESFNEEWFNAKSEQELKETILHNSRFVSVKVKREHKSETLIGKTPREVHTPTGCLVAILQRGGEIIAPHGNTVFEEGDRLTIIGNKQALEKCRKCYVE
ncbi:MAG: amino acid permease [Verrucomicrobia bacterium]|nr:amino acid permease [Verrucomicrobiota bacterium]